MDKKMPDPKENVQPKFINPMKPFEVDKLAGIKLEESQEKLLPGKLQTSGYEQKFKIHGHTVINYNNNINTQNIR